MSKKHVFKTPNSEYVNGNMLSNSVRAEIKANAILNKLSLIVKLESLRKGRQLTDSEIFNIVVPSSHKRYV